MLARLKKMYSRQTGINLKPSFWLGISVFLLIIIPSVTYADPFRATLIVSKNSSIFTETADTIRSLISDKSEHEIIINIISIEQIRSLSNKSTQNTDLYIPIGQASFKEILKHAKSSSILATLIPRESFYRILNDNSVTQTNNKLNVGAVFLDQPDERLILLTRLALPNIKRAGMLISYNGVYNNKEKLNILFQKNNLDFHIEEITPSANIMRKITLMLDDIDALIATPDPIIFNRRSTRNILLSTYRQRIPVIGFSRSYVKAGALASAYSTPQQIGKQTGELIILISNHNTTNSLPIEYAKYFDIAVNNQVARSLGYPFLDSNNLKNSLLEIEESRND